MAQWLYGTKLGGSACERTESEFREQLSKSNFRMTCGENLP